MIRYGLFICDSYLYKLGDVISFHSEDNQPLLKPVKGFAQPLNLISNPKEKFFYIYAPSSGHPHSKKFCINSIEEPDLVPLEMPDNNIPMPFSKDFIYQTSNVSSATAFSNHYLISICKDKALYHPIQSKLMLRSKRSNSASFSKKGDGNSDMQQIKGISVSRRKFSENELDIRNERLVQLFPQSVLDKIKHK